MSYTAEVREGFRQRALAAMQNRPVDPTEEEIAAACEAIQAGWTHLQRRYRYMMPRTVDSIHETDLGGWTPQEWRAVDFCVG